MTEESIIGSNKVRQNSAIVSLALILRQKEIGVTVSDLKKEFELIEKVEQSELIRCLQGLDVKSKWHCIVQSDLLKMPLPALVETLDGEFCVLLQANENSVLIQKYRQDRAEQISISDYFSQFKESVLLVAKDQKAEQDSQREFGFSWFFKTIFKYKSIMREALLASFFIQLFALVTPLFFMIIIDKVFSHNNLSTLDVLVFAMVVVAIFDVVLNGIRTYLMSHTTNRVDLELGSRLFKHLMKLPLSYFESRRSGETIARMREVETIRNFLTGSTLTLLIDLVFLVVFLFVMFLFSVKLFLIVLIALPLFFLTSFFITPLMRNKLEDKHQKIAENQSFLVETLGGIETVKSSSVEGHCQRHYEEKLADLSKCSFQTSNLANLINQATNFISKVLTVILLYVGAKLVLSGDLSVGQLIAFNMLSGRVIQPIQRLAQIWQEFTGMKVSIQRVADILKSPTEPVLLRGKTELRSLNGNIKFDHVDFAYSSDSPNILEDISIDIPAGQVVGIVGSTGSGKTTLIKLLQRLYVPSRGIVSIDGINLVSLDGNQLRRQIGVVAQDFVLFNRTIKDNIGLGDTSLTDDAIMSAAEAVGVHSMIMSLPEGYDTVLQERGRGLSTGQRQGIALARAIVTNPKILILDEATSAMDYQSEQRFQEKFSDIIENRTVIVVAHRLSTVKQAHRILTIEGGRIIEDGTPKELLSTKGRFAELYGIHQTVWSN